MKTKLVVSVALMFGLALALGSAGQQSAGELYKAGLYEEEVGGNLQKAITIYQDILKRFPGDREIAAKAQLHIGLCYEKLGAEEAAKAFQKVIEDFPDQPAEVREAREKLSLLVRTRAAIETGSGEFNLRQVWTGPGVDIMGAVSPDGRYLSFVDWTTGDLAIRDIAAGTNRRLTNKGSWERSQEFALFSKWAPDSRHIVYQWYAKDEIFELRVIDIKEAAPRVLYRVLEKMEYVQAFDWSPDGRSILASLFKTSAPSPPYSVEEITQLGSISVSDGSLSVLKTFVGQSSTNLKAWGFAYSPDGKYIAYDAWMGDDRNDNRDIFLLAADGSAEIPLIEHPALDAVIDWTPDGAGLLFSSNRTGAQDVWFVRISEGKPLGSPLMVKPGVGSIWPMGITSTGALFYGLQGGGTDVYEVDIEPGTGKVSSPVKKAVLFHEGHNAYPDYSPDGKFLAYIYTASMPAIRAKQILRILSLETGRVREFTLDLDGFGYPRWAPDGRSVSVEGTGKDGRNGIYRVDIQSGDMAPIVRIEKGTEIYSHRWSTDGNVMFYSTGDRAGKTGSIFIHHLETGQAERISGSPSDAQFFDISPDGKRLVLANKGSKIMIRTMPTSGGDLREIHSFEQEGSHPITPVWSANGRYVYFPMLRESRGGISPGGMWDLFRIAADGGEAQKIDLSMGGFRHFSAQPDGRHFAFSSRGTNPEQSQVWVMENFLPTTKK